jgi:hypothetical protein
MADSRISGPVFAVMTFLSIPYLSQNGTKTIPPPIPTTPPKKPERKP